MKANGMASQISMKHGDKNYSLHSVQCLYLSSLHENSPPNLMDLALMFLTKYMSDVEMPISMHLLQFNLKVLTCPGAQKWDQALALFDTHADTIKI